MNIDDLATALEVVSPEDQEGAPFPDPSIDPKKTRPLGEKIPAGERDKTFFRAASYLAGLGNSEKTIKKTLWETYENDMEHKDSDRESEVKARIAQKAKRAIDGAANDTPTVAPTPAAINKGPLFVSVPSLLDNPRKPNWMVRGLIEMPSTAMTFGPPEIGKSFLAVDLAVATALNGRWMDKRVTGGPVYYLAGEGHVGLERRFLAWQLHHGLARLPENLYLSTARIALDVAGGLRVESEVERISNTTGTNPALIVVDTLARAFPPGKDENSAKDMGEFINEVDRIRTRFNCVAMLVHHTGHTDTHRARGSSSMRGAWDAELSVSMNGSTRMAQWTKLKDQPKDSTGREFALIPVIIGMDDDVEEGENPLITSCCVEWQGTAKVHKDIAPTKTEKLGLDTLMAAMAGRESTALDPWRTAFYAKHWADNDDAKQKAFVRVRASLAGKGLIAIDGYNYSIAKHSGGQT